MARGSDCYAKYYLVQIFLYLGLGVAGVAIFFEISPQCKPLCPTAAADDLALAGYDRDNKLFGFQTTKGGPKAGENGAPHQYTYYYACNMTGALGTAAWWNRTGEVAKYDLWETAVKQSANSNFMGSHLYFWWENATAGLWDSDKAGAGRTITLRDNTVVVVKSKCYLCCDPAYMAQNGVCMPSISGPTVYTWCATPSQCKSGFMPVANFPTPPDISLRVMANLQLLILGASYLTQSISCMLIYCGLSTFQGKYEGDFNSANLSLSERILGLFAKKLPLANRVLNTFTIFFVAMGVVVAVSNRVCTDAHDAFGKKTYFPTLEGFTFATLSIFCSTCAMGTVFRAKYTQDTAFLLPSDAVADDVYGKTCGELCCEEGRPGAAVCKGWRQFQRCWCQFGP